MLFRLLLTSLIALLVAPALVTAQTTEPVGTVATGDDEVARAYDNPTVYFDALSGVIAFGQIHDDLPSAQSAIRTFPTVFAASISAELEGDTGFTMGEVEEVEIDAIGEQSAAHRLPFTMFGSFEGEYGLILVRQQTWVQILLGFGVGEIDVITELQSLATTMLPRWPSTDPIAVREDGLRTGGIWAMMPKPEDLAAGFVIDEEFEEGPGATTDEIVPVPTATPEPAGTPAQPTVEAPETPAPTAPGRDLPLLPTLPPEPDAPAAPTEAEPTAAPTEPGLTLPELDATGTPPATAPAPGSIATPSTMNPRLATPFDVTVEIIMPAANAEIADDGSCQGRGLLAGLAGGEALTLREAETGEPSVTAQIAAPGMIAYDTELRQEVCYLTATFTEVPPRGAYTLLAGESVLGRYTFEELTAEDTLLVVLGDEEPEED